MDREKSNAAIGYFNDGCKDRPTWRIWAENSPYETKDILKARGYRWNPDTKGQPRGWCIDVTDAEKDGEERFLKNEIYRRDTSLKSMRLNAYNRYSDCV